MKRKDILFILISSFVLTVVWVGFSLYSSSVTSTISETQGMQIKSIRSTFDQDAITAIKNRSVIQPVFESQILGNAKANLPPGADISPSPTIQPLLPNATDSTETPPTLPSPTDSPITLEQSTDTSLENPL